MTGGECFSASLCARFPPAYSRSLSFSLFPVFLSVPCLSLCSLSFSLFPVFLSVPCLSLLLHDLKRLRGVGVLRRNGEGRAARPETRARTKTRSLFDCPAFPPYFPRNAGARRSRIGRDGDVPGARPAPLPRAFSSGNRGPRLKSHVVRGPRR